MTRLVAALHELRCHECRVTWRSWLARLVGLRSGYAPKGHRQWSGVAESDDRARLDAENVVALLCAPEPE
jgi:hypothetical protein